MNSLNVIKMLSALFFLPERVEDMLAINLNMFAEIHLARQMATVSVQATNENSNSQRTFKGSGSR